MSEPVKKIVQLKPETVSPDRMLVTMNAGELRELIGEVVEQKLKRLNAGRANGLMTVEQAAEFLGYSKDWVFKHWKKVGGKKIGGRGVRFDLADLENWVKSRG
jgi:excisionase family DNA binding protein